MVSRLRNFISRWFVIIILFDLFSDSLDATLIQQNCIVLKYYPIYFPMISIFTTYQEIFKVLFRNCKISENMYSVIFWLTRYNQSEHEFDSKNFNEKHSSFSFIDCWILWNQYTKLKNRYFWFFSWTYTSHRINSVHIPEKTLISWNFWEYWVWKRIVIENSQNIYSIAMKF